MSYAEDAEVTKAKADMTHALERQAALEKLLTIMEDRKEKKKVTQELAEVFEDVKRLSEFLASKKPLRIN